MGIVSQSWLRMECDRGLNCEGTTLTHPVSTNPLVIQKDAKAQGWLMGINHQGLFLTFCPARTCQEVGRKAFTVEADKVL